MNIFIGSSSSKIIDKKYLDITIKVCTILSRLKYNLIFGGCEYGMMGKSYLTFKFEERKVKAIASLEYLDDLKALELDDYEVVKNTFDKSKRLYENCDVALFMPGGIGSLAELFSMIEQKRNDKDSKPIILFNYDNYYMPLINMLKSMHKEKFVSEEDIKKIMIVNDIEALRMYFERLGKRN